MLVAEARAALHESAYRAASSDEVEYLVANLFGPDEPVQALSVRYAQPSGSVTRVHYHAVPQFQLVTHGTGWLGRHAVDPYIVHYVDAFTPYGPIVDSGTLGYMTLRSRRDPAGPRYMPDSRAALARQRGATVRRNVTVPVPAELPSTSGDLLDPQPDGLAVRLHLFGSPGETAPEAAAAPGARYLVVLSGVVVLDGCRARPLSVLFLGPGEAFPDVAGSHGRVVELEFPH